MAAEHPSGRDSATITTGEAQIAAVPPETDRARRRPYARLAAIGLAGGLFSGLLGVGGGVVMVPLLVLWAGYGQRNAHAISLGAIIPISAAGVITFGAAGEIQVWEALALAAGSIVGAQVGASMLSRIDEQLLKLVFGSFMLVVAVLLAVGR
ncbi:MAG TPA: sulfite exporter TauE/SafE family protein [Gaiellaceae bacterium]|nr:sulfite exporter TauE/SafE family protein [Gaiellaceae bacterium]